MLKALMDKIEEGYSEGIYNDKKYGITKTIFNKGNSLKVYAEELGGNDFISLNYYVTKTNELLKPCEIPEQKVIHFLKNVVLISNE
ncbi:peptide methionine sulfoxide reductase [Winogradskyella sp.]|uniref:peptide methionine sulfoxide reductase n=1 Tax=Winogradskyella sp. TaxID=1883156 RepID=UPI0025DDA519|nr:peptide methionine sulfoxide reductase [Winogradskyella sp.]